VKQREDEAEMRLSSIFVSVLVACLLGCVNHQTVAFRVLTFNIHHGEGMDGQVDLDRIAQVIRQTEAVLVALQEVDRGVERTNQVDQPAKLAELTGMRAIFEKNIDYQGGEYGNVVLSRFPVEFHENHYLPKSPSNEQRGVLEVHLQVAGGKLVFFATHFDHQADDGERMASVATLRQLVERHRGIPIIVAGDLNASPGGRAMLAVTAFLRLAADGSGFTYPADDPVRRIDYVLHNRHPRLRCITGRVIPELVASDHRPVLAVFELVVAGP